MPLARVRWLPTVTASQQQQQQQHIPQGWIDSLCRFPTFAVFTLSLASRHVSTLVLLLHLSSIYIAAAAGNPPWFWTTKRIVVVVVAALRFVTRQILTRVPRMKTGRQRQTPHSFRGTWTLETSVKWELCCQLLYRHCRRRGIYHHRRPPVTIWFNSQVYWTLFSDTKRQIGEIYRTQSCWISSAETTNCR